MKCNSEHMASKSLLTPLVFSPFGIKHQKAKKRRTTNSLIISLHVLSINTISTSSPATPCNSPSPLMSSSSLESIRALTCRGVVAVKQLECLVACLKEYLARVSYQSMSHPCWSSSSSSSSEYVSKRLGRSYYGGGGGGGSGGRWSPRCSL
jgi:uncharacterized membrane protein YgcG